MGTLHRGRGIVWTAIWAAAMATATEPNEARAQRGVLTDLYGRGVHDYFAGRYHEARDQFTSAINAGSRDPRAYYFRGLTLRVLGESQLADEDFRAAAGLEYSPSGRAVNVGRALERVQGPDRLHVEQFRREARLAAARTVAPRRRTFDEPLPHRTEPGTSSGVSPASSTVGEPAPSPQAPPMGPPAVPGVDIGPRPLVPAVELPKAAGAPPAAPETNAPENQAAPKPSAAPTGRTERGAEGGSDIFRQAVDTLFDNLLGGDDEQESPLRDGSTPAEEPSIPDDEAPRAGEGAVEEVFSPTTLENESSNAVEGADLSLDETGDVKVFDPSGSELAGEGDDTANSAGRVSPVPEPPPTDSESFEPESGDAEGDFFAPPSAPEPPMSDATSPAAAPLAPSGGVRGPAETPVTTGDRRDASEADVADEDFFGDEADFTELPAVENGEEAGVGADAETFFTEEAP